MDLIEALRSPEGKILEIKRKMSSPDGSKRTVVAFANTVGGAILVSVAEPLALEGTGREPDQRLGFPRLLPDVKVLSYRDRHVLTVQIHPSAARRH